MFHTPSDLQQIWDIASKKIKDQAKHRDETHEQFLARCWLESVKDVVDKHGYTLSGYDQYTDSSVAITLPKLRR